MAELATQFKTAQSNIEPSPDDWDNAPSAHDEVGTVLAADEKLKEWGINPILIGSYGRRVSIRRVYDVDMFCRLDDYPTDVDASEVLGRAYNVLVDQYGDNHVTLYDTSITVLIPDADGLYIDVVPARKAEDVWEIPTDNGWLKTNPVKLTELKEAKNADYDELYVPCVKLLRQARRTLMGQEAKPGGFTVEMALFTACEEGQVSGQSMAELFASAVEGVADVFRRIADDGFEIPDPTMDGEVLSFDEGADFETARDTFAAAAADARAAYDMAEDQAGKAALLLQGILGANDDFDNVFPMPAGYSPNGAPKAHVTERKPGDRKPTPGNLRFG
ncbi:SMODS domain-containing nucleotidyltransferase [Rhodococcus sp. IEGM1428]|uniref:SMODS domain-containing nucleotidyltransferase n=1 Tax=Rhodococcus sp. IEGM1428 TaxID=3392191 RepID=UPI003D1025D1